MPTKPQRRARGKKVRPGWSGNSTFGKPTVQSKKNKKAVKKSLSFTPAAWRIIEISAKSTAKQRGTNVNYSDAASSLVLVGAASLTLK